MTPLEELRLRINDRARLALNEVVGVGGTAPLLDYRLQFAPVVVGSDVLRTRAGAVLTPLVPAVGYVLTEATGLVTLAGALASGTELLATYTWTVFADAELTDILTQYQDRAAVAALVCVRMLLADSDRFIKYTLGQETVDRARALEALRALLEQLQAEIAGGNNAGPYLADVDSYEEYLLAPWVTQVAEADW